MKERRIIINLTQPLVNSKSGLLISLVARQQLMIIHVTRASYSRLSKSSAYHTPPVVATPVRDAYYGPDGSIPVKVFESSELNILHYAIMGAMVMNNYMPGEHFDPQFAGNNYNPHTSRKVGVRIPQDPITLSHLSLFRRLRGSKIIQERYKLGT